MKAISIQNDTPAYTMLRVVVRDVHSKEVIEGVGYKEQLFDRGILHTDEAYVAVASQDPTAFSLGLNVVDLPTLLIRAGLDVPVFSDYSFDRVSQICDLMNIYLCPPRLVESDYIRTTPEEGFRDVGNVYILDAVPNNIQFRTMLRACAFVESRCLDLGSALLYLGNIFMSHDQLDDLSEGDEKGIRTAYLQCVTKNAPMIFGTPRYSGIFIPKPGNLILTPP